MSRIRLSYSKLKEVENFLRELRRLGQFYPSSIEIDTHMPDSLNGMEFARRLDGLIEDFDKLDIKIEE